MALGFLTGEWDTLGGAGSYANAGGGLSGIAELIKSLSASKTAKSAYNDVVNQGPTDAERQSMALYQALLDPNNSLVKSNADAETKTGVEGLMKTLRAAQLLDQRGQARGRGATFSDPERRDEFGDYILSRGIGGIQSRALDTARNNISNQAAGLKGFIPVQQQRQQDILTEKRNYGDFQNKQLGTGIDQLMNILRPKEKINWNSYPKETINWNTYR